MRHATGLPVLVIGLLGLVGRAPALAGQCAPSFLDVVPATPATVEVPPDGGLLVTSVSTMSPAQSSDLTTWKFATKGPGNAMDRTPPVPIAIAPGLVRLPVAGTQLENGHEAVLVTFTRGVKPVPLLPVPVVKSLTYVQGRRSTSVVAELVTPPVAGYLVVYDEAGTTARSWGPATTTSVAVYAAGGCAVVADGTVPSRAGEKVRLAWVDMFGRVSPPTDPILIASDPDPAPPH